MEPQLPIEPSWPEPDPTRRAEASFGAKQSLPAPESQPLRLGARPAATLHPELEYAGFWVRVGATCIDGILAIAITWPILFAVYGESYLEMTGYAGPLDFVLTGVFPAIAVVLFWIFRAATPGKMALAARIADARTGLRPTVGQCIGRYFAYVLSSLPFGLGFLWVAWDPRRQGWHDKLAGTVVVRKRNEPAVVQFEDELPREGDAALPPPPPRAEKGDWLPF